MTDPMTPERLAEIEARANAATQGPWEWHPYMGSGATLAKPNHPFHELNILKTTDDWPPVAADAEFIAAARTDVPALLAEVRRLQAAVERVRELHRPGDYSASRGVWTWWDVCPTCGDKAGVHPCGCWRDVDEDGHICKACSKPGRVSEPWPCPTIAALDGPGESA